MNTMQITEKDLLNGERLIQTKNANAIIELNTHGLSQFSFDQLMWTVGMKGKESIGGKIHLTNYRLIFKSHAINRLTGKFSIFLPTIQEVKNTSKFIAKKMEVTTGTQQFTFVIWGISSFMDQIEAAKNAISDEALEFIRMDAVKNYKQCGEGLEIFSALEAINLAILSVQDIKEIVEISQNPVETSSILNLMELFSQE